MTQVWGSLVIFILCPLIGGLPLIDWIARALAGQSLQAAGTGNVSVSAAFYHGGKLVGILAVLSEALKGIGAVLLARAFFPTDPVWELVALIALVIGRYWRAKGAGTTNVIWGIAVHDPITAGLVFLIAGISFTIFRHRTSGRLGALVLFVLILALRHPQPERIGAAMILAGLLAWIYSQIPDDLNLSATHSNPESQKVFRFFRGDRALRSLDDPLDAHQVGQKAATLSQLKRWGYAVPDGWVLPAGDDPKPLLEFFAPTVESPVVVRSSALGEDSETASAAGQYTTVLNVSDRLSLQTAIFDCLASYNNPAAVQYRRERHQEDSAMAVIVQQQIRGAFSGVAFSRNPLDQLDSAVVIEALPGDAAQVVSGKATPHQYRVQLQEPELAVSRWDSANLDDRMPAELLQSVAQLAREIEDRYHGIPQDIEWTYDGQQLWVLQARPITTLQPIWTRKIASEVIPGIIRPLTWSINQPLTCGVWGEIFTIVLGKRASELDFSQTATLHFSRAYFNATLLGKIFRRMGLPPESLEFLTRGAKMTKPPLLSTLHNLPGLLRLLQREWRLEQDFERDKDRYFAATLDDLQEQPVAHLSAEALLSRIETILDVLKRATYYSILAPLSLALRQTVLKVSETDLDSSQTPEIASLRSLSRLAVETRHLLPKDQLASASSASLFAHLAESPDGENILEQFQQWLNRYGYLSKAATDIAVPRWREDPRPVRELFAQLLATPTPSSPPKSQGWKAEIVQKRLTLKGQATELYSQFLAHLRWSFLALAQHWQQTGVLEQAEDIFFLEWAEIRQAIAQENDLALPELIRQRQIQFQQHQELTPPLVTFGTPSVSTFSQTRSSHQQFQGIAASPGQVEGRVKVVHTLENMADIDRQTILVVPYTDSGWSPLLARAGGLVSEVGGRLSHGAIVAREYGIPAVMDVHDATQVLQDGQQIRLDGQRGTVEILDAAE
ncbi:MAG: glycerol-3-phosphate acyltransferase [Cyanophyceae cyanobacterium]